MHDLPWALLFGLIIILLGVVVRRGHSEGDMPSDDAIRHITDPYSDQERH